MQTRKPLISVIIPHLNQVDYLRACLASLEAQSQPRGDFEILVVDNGSLVLPHDVIAQHPGVQLLQEPTPGPGMARNCGVAASKGETLCFIDADCRAHPLWLESILRALEAYPAGTIIGGDVRIWRNDLARFTAIEAYESVFAYRFKMYIEKQGYSGTGNLAVRRVDFDRVGPFGGLQIAEDVDWGARARSAGLTIRYVQDMIVYHPARRTLRELFVKWDRHIQHALNEARGKPWWRARWLTRALAVLVSPAVDAVKVLASDRLEGGSARLKAIAVLTISRGHRAWRMLALMAHDKGVVWNRSAALGPSTPTTNH